MPQHTRHCSAPSSSRARHGPRITRCRPTCRRPATEAGCHAGRARCAALLVPALWRSHDRHRGVRARLRAAVAANASCDRHVMSETPVSIAAFPFRYPGSHAGGDLSRPNRIHQGTNRALIPTERLPKCLLHFPIAPGARHAGRVALALRHQSRAALTSNPHSARCTASA
jgi:hypothetical protein